MSAAGRPGAAEESGTGGHQGGGGRRREGKGQFSGSPSPAEKIPTAPWVTKLNAWVTNGYIPSSTGVNSMIAPCAGARSTACEPQPPALPRSSSIPSLITLSKIVPTTWNEESVDGPASSTKTRTRLPAATSTG